MTPDTFWTYVDRTAGDGCWPWTGAINVARKGYGLVRFGGKTRYAHRVAWTLANGREPGATLHICHLCDNPACCNPAHLYEGTPARNNQDIVDHGRAWWQNATHCRRGHEWTPENTAYGRFPKNPHIRRCLTCEDGQRARNAASTRARYWAKKAATTASGRTSS